MILRLVLLLEFSLIFTVCIYLVTYLFKMGLRATESCEEQNLKSDYSKRTLAEFKCVVCFTGNMNHGD